MHSYLQLDYWSMEYSDTEHAQLSTAGLLEHGVRRKLHYVTVCEQKSSIHVSWQKIDF